MTIKAFVGPCLVQDAAREARRAGLVARAGTEHVYIDVGAAVSVSAARDLLSRLYGPEFSSWPAWAVNVLQGRL